MIEEFIPLLSNVGFPITITLYLLVRMEKVINANTTAIREFMLVSKR